MNIQTRIRIRRPLLPATILLLLFVWSCAQSPTPVRSALTDPGDHALSLNVNGIRREYIIHVPAGYDPKQRAAVVMMFHGGGGTAAAAMRQTGWTGKAEAHGFLAVFPEGTRPDASRPARFAGNPQTWNDGSNRRQLWAVRNNADDIAFVNALIDELIVRFHADRHRIYVAGFSNGASMAFHIARQLSRRVAAVAAVAGTDWMSQPEVWPPVSLLYITGTADPLNPMEGGDIRIGLRTYGHKPPVKDMIRNWVRMLGCPPQAVVVQNVDGLGEIAYGPCRQESEVRIYTIEAMGHAWPGGIRFLPERIVGKYSDRINATDIIWAFFQQHRIR